MDKVLSDRNNLWSTQIKFDQLEKDALMLYVSEYSDALKESFKISPFNFKDIDTTDPLEYATEYNVFLGKNTQIYDLLVTIKKMFMASSKLYDIEYQNGRYFIHGWIERYNGSNNGVSLDNLVWDDASFNTAVFSGFLAIDAEPSKDHYLIDGIHVEVENKNGTVYLFNGLRHAHGEWKEERPKIVIAFNIAPYAQLNENEAGRNSYLPIV